MGVEFLRESGSSVFAQARFPPPLPEKAVVILFCLQYATFSCTTPSQRG